MTNTTVAAGLTVTQWDDKYFTEYFQENLFNSEMGTSQNSIIQVKEDLTKKKGDKINFALVNRLVGAGVTGNSTLEGNEEALDTRSHLLTVTQRRHAVRVSDYDNQLSSISLRDAGRGALMDWSHEDTRDRIITALGSVNGIAYGTATEAQKDAWLDDNNDRCLFGAAKSNTTATGGTVAYDHSDSLTNIDNTADKLTAAAASLMKRIALSASPKIRPVRSASSGRRYYVMYLPSLVFRDLKDDSTITQAQRDVGLRMQNEKLFQGGDIEWDGIIFKEIDDIAIITDSTIDVGPAYLCGAQAIGYGVAKRWNTVTENFDYDDKKGIAVREFGGFDKLTFGSHATVDTTDPKDHGLVTGFFAAVADS
jgi:N4-gp56 family major capsid protein